MMLVIANLLMEHFNIEDAARLARTCKAFAALFRQKHALIKSVRHAAACPFHQLPLSVLSSREIVLRAVERDLVAAFRSLLDAAKALTVVGVHPRRHGTHRERLAWVTCVLLVNPLSSLLPLSMPELETMTCTGRLSAFGRDVFLEMQGSGKVLTYSTFAFTAAARGVHVWQHNTLVAQVRQRGNFGTMNFLVQHGLRAAMLFFLRV